MSFRFIHSADIHLDSPLASLALRNAELAALIGNATRTAFTRIIDLCLEEQVDALLLCGDLYDGDQTSMKTARFLVEQLKLLDAAGIRTFVIRGNHDALSKITRELTLPDSVKLFRSTYKPVELTSRRGALPIAVHGISFSQPHAPASLLPNFRPVADAINIGLLHTSLEGAPPHDPYAPCKLTDLHAAGFRYWALGHVHKRSVASGLATVVMPGIPQGRDIGEAGPKSATLVTITDDGAILLEERLTSVAEFTRVGVDLTGIEDWRAMLRAVEAAIGRARDAAASEHLIARIALTGATELGWRLRQDTELLRAEYETLAGGFRNAWIDKIELACSPPVTQMLDSTGVVPFEELHLLMHSALDDEAYRAEISQIGEELSRQLPRECRSDIFGANPESFDAAVTMAAREGIEDVLARLRAGELRQN